MEKQTPETLNLARDEKQEGHLAQISTTAAVAVTIEPGIARQPIQPPEPEPGPTPPPKPEPEVSISINSPVPNATVFVPLSKGTFTVTGSVSAILLTIQKVDVQFENLGFGTVTRSGSSWSCTSSKIVASRMLTITAKVTATNGTTATATRTVAIVVADDIPPMVTINQPAADGFQVQETNGKFFLTLQGTASDSPSGIQKVAYTVNGNTQVITPPFSGGSPPTVNWQAVNIEVPYSSDPQTITISATDANNNVGVKQRTVKTVETNPPMLQITEPIMSGQDQIILPATDTTGGGILPRLAGNAQDTQSGVKSVEWALDPQPSSSYTTAVFFNEPTKNPVNWSVQNIPIPGPEGTPHTIRVRCSDAVGNRAEKDVRVAVSGEYPPKDPTVQEYFSSLIDFIVHRVKVTNQNRSLKVEDLKAEFYQPFQSLLSIEATLSNQQVHQIRICIEVLRQYLAKHGPLSAVAQQALQQAEAAYRQTAYETLLKRIGTSFAEIRAARLADEPTRQALAQRLGFDLKPQPVEDPIPPTSLRSSAIVPVVPEPTPVPDTLQQLLLQPGQFTEAHLETLFGLVNTTRDPLQDPSVNPKLLDWQLQFLKAGWGRQDDAAAVPIIDPDVLGEADLQAGSAAYFVWQSRYIWVNGRLEALKKVRESLGNDLLTGFDTVIKGTLGPSADLVALDAQRVAGADIEPQLAQKQLTLAAFVHLMSLRKLAAAGTLLASEWDDVYSPSWCR